MRGCEMAPVVSDGNVQTTKLFFRITLLMHESLEFGIFPGDG